MKQTICIFWTFCTCLPLFTYAQLSTRIANYEMEVILDVDEKKLHGKTHLDWHNPGSSPTDALYFHMYYNAFKHSETTFMQGIGELPSFFQNSLREACGWGWTRILTMEDDRGNDLAVNMQYVQPDDQNEMDETVLKVSLPEPVAPGDSISIEFTWEARIPKAVIRTGYNKDYFFMAQWFPKLGVYEPAGTRGAKADRWNCHQYHAIGEYYADFGSYEVSLTVPADFVVGASGTLVRKEPVNQGTTWTFQAHDVIDFAWTASPHFVIQKETWEHVEISLLTYPDHTHFGDRYFRAAKDALGFLDKAIGKYPYRTLTMVDPPIHGFFSGGMEYPTLITSLSFCFLPRDLKSVETLVTHEFIHQYFMQMVATNEQEEPWLDEGITTYYEGRILDHYLGEQTSFADLPWFKAGSTAFNRWEYFNSPHRSVADLDRPARDYRGGGFGVIVYNKTAIWLKTLEGLIGKETFDKAMKTYFQRWKFRHPGRADFEAVFNEVVTREHGSSFGPDLDWFFSQVIESTRECDYAVGKIVNRKVKPGTGFLESTDHCIRQEEVQRDQERYHSSVQVRRPGTMILPVDIRIRFSDGTERWESWDGRERAKTYTYNSPSKIMSVEIDPQRKLWIDRNFLNNGKAVKKQKSQIQKRWITAFKQIQNIMETISGIL